MGEVRQLRQTPTVEPLWRDVLGAQLRLLRTRRHRTITTTARRAGISAQYLSEVERGRKDPSSEIVAAIAGALDSTVAEITDLTTRELRRATAQQARAEQLLELRSTAHRSATSIRGPVALAA
ncbi:helix-turn-helix domain-containing protein [Flexivirga oryzae]|uniref:Transcriptional regulator with XRE-family HTH domain n=1 Tax=Flexivirga oryzae TaxID=1794944 RepID=A0A839NF91_9MICO|nr:helix-turn-helix transcriptional regulator [Flexivirga oryzae]MBB2894594.1 transcriptional regulator with XRE-family HTH domain [Flexivirga oryzae]